MNKLYFCFVFLSVFLLSCTQDEINPEYKKADSYNAQVPLIWNKFYLEIERFTAGYKPPVSARNLGYINLAAYESIVGGSNGKYKSFGAYYPELKLPALGEKEGYDWEVVAHSAYERSFELFFPTAPSKEQFQMLQLSSDLREK